jgi:hypothetical protein
VGAYRIKIKLKNMVKPFLKEIHTLQAENAVLAFPLFGGGFSLAG